jgi:arylsulfatase
VVSRGGGSIPELYNLAVDLRESNDLAAKQPDKVKALQAKWDKWSAEQSEASAPDSPGKAKKQNKKKQAAK